MIYRIHLILLTKWIRHGAYEYKI